MSRTVWFIGSNMGYKCGQHMDNQHKLSLCKWSTDKNVVDIQCGCSFHVFTVSNIDRNRRAVHAFIAQCQRSLPYRDNAFYTIFDGLIMLCVQYFGDHFVEFYGAGYNGHHQCGVNSTSTELHTLTHVASVEDTPMAKVCTGIEGWSLIWIDYQGNAYANGANYSDQIGMMNKQKAVPVPTLLQFFQRQQLQCVAASASDTFSSVVCSDGSVYTSGSGPHGELGLSEHVRNVAKFTKIDIFDTHPIVKVALCYHRAVYLARDGSVFNTGDDGEDEQQFDPTHIEYFGQHNLRISDVRCGSHHCMALCATNGTVYCWGSNGRAQCSPKQEETVLQPALVKELSACNEHITDIRAGGNHSGCRSQNGNVYLWGCNCANECLSNAYSASLEDDEQVSVPWCINKTVTKVTNSKHIIDFFLSGCSTFIVVSDIDTKM